MICLTCILGQDVIKYELLITGFSKNVELHQSKCLLSKQLLCSRVLNNRPICPKGFDRNLSGSVKIQYESIGGEQEICEVLLEEGMRNATLLFRE